MKLHHLAAVLALSLTGVPSAHANVWLRFNPVLPVLPQMTVIGAAWQAANPSSQGVPGTPAEVALGLADFAVGRIQGVTTTHFLSMAASRLGQIDNAATGDFTVAAAPSTPQFIIDRTKIPAGYGFLDGSDPGAATDSSRAASSVTMQCMDDPTIYTNGSVKSWVDSTSTLTLNVTTATRGGVGITGKTNSIPSVGAGSCPSGSYRLALHVPSTFFDNTSYLAFGSVAGTNLIRDWDFSNLADQVFISTSNVYTIGNPNSVDTWDNNIFESATRGGVGTHVLFKTQNGGPTPLIATNNTFKLTTYKFAPTTPTTVTLVGPASNQLTFSSLPADMDKTYMITDLSNPAGVGGMVVTAFDTTANTVTFQWSNGSVAPQGPQDLTRVKVGDRIQFYRPSTVTSIFAYAIQNISNNYIEVANDLMNPNGNGAAAADLTFSNNRVRMFGEIPGLHADVLQAYGYPSPGTPGGNVNLKFNWLTIQAIPGLSAGGNPRDVAQFGGGTGYYPFNTEYSFNKIEGGNMLSGGTPPVAAPITSPTKIDDNTFQFVGVYGGDYVLNAGDPLILRGLSVPGLNGLKHIVSVSKSGANYTITMGGTTGVGAGEINLSNVSTITSTITKTVQYSPKPTTVVNSQLAGPQTINMTDTSGLTGGGLSSMLVSNVASITAANPKFLSNRVLTTAVTPTSVTTDRPVSGIVDVQNNDTVTFSAYMQTVNVGGISTHDNYFVPQMVWGMDGSYVSDTGYYSTLQQGGDEMGSSSNIHDNYALVGSVFVPHATNLPTGNGRQNTINSPSWNHVAVMALGAISPASGTIQLSITDDGSARSDPVSWEYSLDSGPWSALASNFTISGLPAGAHLIKAHSKSAPNYTYPSVMNHTGPDSVAVGVTVN